MGQEEDEDGDIHIELTAGGWNLKIWIDVDDRSNTRVTATATQNRITGTVEARATDHTVSGACALLEQTIASIDATVPPSDALDRISAAAQAQAQGGDDGTLA